MRFSNFFVLASLSISSLASTVADVKTGLIDLGVAADGLGKVIQDISPIIGTLVPAIAAHTAVPIFQGNINRLVGTINSVDKRTVTDDDANDILDLAEEFQPKLNSVLGQLLDRKSLFLATLTYDLLKKDVAGLDESVRALGDALVSVTPDNSKASAQGLKANLDITVNRFTRVF